MGIELGFAFGKARVRESKRDGNPFASCFAVVALRYEGGRMPHGSDETVWRAHGPEPRANTWSRGNARGRKR